MPILVGTDGKQKMSKSLDNYIGVEEPPNDMYGKVMSMPDEVIITYFELITDVDDDEIEEFKKQLTDGSVHPMDLKKRLAFEIVMQFHDEKAACDADAHFSKVVQQKELPDEIQEAKVSFKALATDKEGEIRLPELLLATGLVDSKGEARRMLAQGAVQIDGNKATDASAKIENGSIVKVGKRRIRKIINTD